MNNDFELRLLSGISIPLPGLTPGTALRAVGSGTKDTNSQIGFTGIFDLKNTQFYDALGTDIVFKFLRGQNIFVYLIFRIIR